MQHVLDYAFFFYKILANRRNRGRKQMITCIIVIVGILSYLAPIPAKGITPQLLLQIFMENHNVVGWICAGAATAHYFFSDDWDETLPKIGMIVMDIIAAADLILKGGIWLMDKTSSAQGIQEALPVLGFILLPVALVLLNLLWGKNRPAEEQSMAMAKMMVGADFAVLGLTFILCYVNPVTSPYLTYTEFGFQVVGQLSGVPENFVPTFGNIPSWSWQLKLLLGVSVILILESYLCDVRKSFARFVNNVLFNTAVYVISVYVMLGFFKLRTYVYYQFWYFFVELAIVVAFGMVAVLLPFILLFPNTARVLTSGVGASSGSSGRGTLGNEGPDAMERYKASRSVQSLPAVIYLEREQLTRQSLDGYSAVYYDESRNEYVITSVSISENSAFTNIGYVHWY